MKDIKKEAGNILIVILIILVLAILALAVYVLRNNKIEKMTEKEIFANLEKTEATLTEYIVYGTHLNIKGRIDGNFLNVKEVNLILKNLEKEESLKLEYQKDVNNINFSTGNLLNRGIDLENMQLGKNIMLIEIKYSPNGKKNKILRFSIKNTTEYKDIEYYTITKNNSNNKIDIAFDTFKREEDKIDYMYIKVAKAKLPQNVYDIVLDPGHGGSDTGAQGGGYCEADLTLEYVKKIKSELEKLGFKVQITRDGTENPETFGTQTVYQENGRVNIVRRF